jgi:ankyrin repeat protein
MFAAAEKGLLIYMRDHRSWRGLLGAFPVRLVVLLFLGGTAPLWFVPAFHCEPGDLRMPPDDTGRLHWAAERGDLAMISRCLSRGVAVDARDVVGATPLFDAARRGRLNAVRYLLDRGADPNAQVRAFGTPLMVAIGSGDGDVVAELLRHGADANAASDMGRTPLSIAVEDRDCDAGMVRVLLRAGARFDPRQAAGRSTLRAAVERHDKEILALLRSAENDPAASHRLPVQPIR